MKKSRQPQSFSMNNYSVIQQLASKPLSFNKGDSSSKKLKQRRSLLYEGLLPKQLLRESHLIFS